jgi:hypothetical protein
MANRYGEAALIAARDSSGTGPAKRWQSAVEKVYPTSVSAQKKGGARGAFLGLCEEGLVKGIPAGSYMASNDNKAYAIRAAELLIAGTQSWSISQLWRTVTDDPEKAHNSQMDIVLALWKNGLIVRGRRDQQAPTA